MQVSSTEIVLAAKQKKKYANAHTYHVNSIALSSDQQTFITADDLRINLWNLEHENKAFNVIDMKPPNMEELTEVCTALMLLDTLLTGLSACQKSDCRVSVVVSLAI